MNKTIAKLFPLLTLLISLNGWAAPADIRPFIGLWEAVDAKDGSLLTLSISRLDKKTARLLVHDTYWTLCSGDRGVAEGTADVSTEKTLESHDYTVTCFEDSGTGPMTITLTRNPDGTLTRLGPPETLGDPVIYHRINK